MNLTIIIFPTGVLLMKILMISPLPPPFGGISHWTTLVCAYAKKMGDAVEIINTAPKNRGVDGRTFFQRIVNGLVGIYPIYRHLKQVTKIFHPDVAHLCTSASFSLVRDYIVLKFLKRMNTPCAYHLHFGRVPALKLHKNWEWKLLLKNISLSDFVITMNEDTQDALRDIVDSARLFNIPNPIDIDSLPAPMEYASHEKYILYLGWIVKTKGIEELLSAWKQIKETLPAWRLKLVGPASEAYLKALTEQDLLNDVDLIGELPHDKAMQYMQKAGIFVLPSYSEGFPNVILEAMALQVPVIATRVGSLPEMLDDDEGLISPQNISDLADQLTKLATSEQQRTQIAEKLYQRAIRNYEISIVYKQYKAIWNKKQN